MGAVLHTLNIRLDPHHIAYAANQAEDQILVADASLTRILAPVLPLLDSVHTVLTVGVGDTADLRTHGKNVVSYEELIADASSDFDWPELDETSAAAMCYTSGTTGQPKGVVYSHRSLFLHAMSVCSGNAMGISLADSVLPVVPMFHANAWGLPHAVLMAGADLVLPDRCLNASSLIDLITRQQVTVAGAVPTIWGVRQ
jgi:acyl-CoA synthetase (AMP-forming)/AMP-acid ligase II